LKDKAVQQLVLVIVVWLILEVDTVDLQLAVLYQLEQEARVVELLWVVELVQK
jgi:hypothetical protein